MRTSAVLSLGAAALLLAAAPATAAVPLAEGERFELTLGGYARLLNGLQLPALEDPTGALVPDAIGLDSSIARLEWKARFGDAVTVELHNRFAWQLSSSALAGDALGLGATRPPDRTVDLSTVLVSEGGARLEHDLDRAVVRLFLGDLDLALGRQAITWGTSNLFTVADVWAAFSPFELDTSQKRGIDAVRALTTLGDGLELDVVVADRGRLEDLSAGARLTWYADFGDVYVAGGKVWDLALLMGGLSTEVDAFKLRGEASLPYRLDADPGQDSGLLAPRVTLGADWFHGDLVLTAEGHLNGAGADDPADYVATASDERHLRGEVYLLGRWYAGLAASYQLTELLTASSAVLANVGDPSALATWSLRYSLSEEAEVSLGGFHGVGAAPTLVPPTLDSELGAYGHLVWLQMAAFF